MHEYAYTKGGESRVTLGYETFVHLKRVCRAVDDDGHCEIRNIHLSASFHVHLPVIIT